MNNLQIKKINNWKRTTYFLFLFATIIFSSNISKAQSLSVGAIAPNFTATDMNGVEHNLYEYLDAGKHVVLKFGFVGCGSCELTRPPFNNAYRNYGCNTEDIIFLEFDTGWQDADIVPSLWLNNGLASQAGTTPFEDVDYVFPEADYITTDGGSIEVAELYGIEFVTHEFIIEPENNTILGSSYNENGVEDEWTFAFGGMIFEGGAEGPGSVPGYTLMTALENEIPDAFHHMQVENIGEFAENFSPLFYVPLNGSAVGETPFTMFCENTQTGCDILKPTVIESSVTVESDTTYQVQLTWTGEGDCTEVFMKYGIKGGWIENQELTTSESVITVNGLYSGLYRFQLRCGCNNIVNYETVDIIVGAETDFTTGTTCTETCNYDLVLHNVVSEADASYLGGQNVWEQVRVRVESENTIEYYTLHDNAHASVGGIWAEAMILDLKFCNSSSIDVKYIEPGFVIPGFVDDLHFSGFKFIDDQENVIAEQVGSYVTNSGVVVNVPTPAGHPGYFAYPTITACAVVGIGEHDIILNDVIMYPNPSSDMVSMEFEKPVKIGAQDLFAVDITGRQIRMDFERINANKYNIDLSKLTSGIYYFVVNNKESRILSKPIMKL